MNLLSRLPRFLMLGIALLTPTWASAATITWIGGSNGDDFNTAADWSTGTIPGPNDTAIISSGTFTVSSQITAGKVTVSAPYAPTSSPSFNITGKWSFTNTFTLNSTLTLNVGGGGTITVSGSTILSGASFYVYGGSVLNLPNVTTFVSPSTGISTQWYVTGTGSQLNFTGLKTITGSPYSNYEELQIHADSGGAISLPVLTSIKQADANGYYAGYVGLWATNGGTISAPLLATFTDTGSSPQSYLEDDAQSSISVPKLTAVTGITVDVYDTAILQQLTSITGGGGLSIGGGTISMNLASINGLSVTVSGGAQVSFPKVTSATGATIYVQDNSNQGTVMTFPALTTITGTVSIAGVGGTLNFPVLTSIASGTVTAQNATTINFTALTSVANLSSIDVYGGSQVNFPAVTSYTSPSSGNSSTAEASGTGSAINFPALKTITGTTFTNDQYLLLQADSGGSISLPVLTSITQADANGFDAGYVWLEDTNGGLITAPLLSTFNDTGSQPESELSADSSSSISVPKLTAMTGIYVYVDDVATLAQLTSLSGGNLVIDTVTATLTNLTSMDGVSVTVTDGAQVSFPKVKSVAGAVSYYVYYGNVNYGAEMTFPALTAFTGSVSFEGQGGTMNFPVLTSIASGTVTAQNATTINFTALTSVANLSSIYVYSGSVVNFSAVTSYTSPSSGNSSTAEASGTGSAINFPALKTITGTTFTNDQYLLLQADSGGSISLPVLTSITQADANGFDAGYVWLEDTNGGLITAPLLSTFNDTGSQPESELSADSSSSISVPKLTAMTGIYVYVDDVATLAQLTSLSGGNLVIDTVTATLTNLTSMDGVSVTVTDGAQVSFPKVKSVAGAVSYYVYYGNVNYGAEMTFPALTAFTGSVSFEGQGGTMNFPVLTSIASGSVSASFTTINFTALTSVANLSSIDVYGGSQVNFPAVTNFTSASSGISASWYVQDAGTQLNFPALQTITGETFANSQSLTLQAYSSGTMNFPVLTSITQSDANGFTSGYVSFYADGGYFNAPLLASFQDNGSAPASSITLYNNARSELIFPDLTSAGLKHITTSGITQTTQTLGAFATIPTQMYGTPYTVVPPVASSKYPVIITVVSGPATISGHVLTFTGVGTVELAANVPANFLFKAPTQQTTSFSVVPGNQTITLGAIPNQIYGTAPFAASATSNSGLPITLTVSGPATISGNMLTLTGVGTVVVTANQAATADWNAAPQVTTSFKVTPAPLTVAVNAGGSSTYGSTPANPGIALTSGTLAAGDTLASIGLADNFALTGASSAGSYTISVTGSPANYTVTPVSATFTINKAPLTVAVNSGGTSIYGSTPVNPGIEVTAGSLFNGDTLAGIGLGDNFALTSTSAPNAYTIGVTGSPANYTVTPVSATFTVTKASQTITAFTTIPTQTYGSAPFSITPPTSSSGLPVLVTVASGPATISASDVVTLTGGGTVVLAANQAGNADYTAAPQVTTSFTVNQTPAITTQPANQSVAPGATATFTAAASGFPVPTVQWEVSTNGGTSYQAISGATSATYSFAATAAESGYLYEAVFTNSVGSVTTNPARLTVSGSSTITITTQPASKTVEVGATATFTSAATGTPTPTVQWQVSTDGGATYQNVSGATSTTLSFVTTVAETGNLYHAVFTNTGGTATSNAATLTVHQAVAITTQPTSQTVAAGATVTFVSAATGSPAPTVQWRVSTNHGSTYANVTGATSPTLSFVTTAAETGYLYHATYTNVVGSVSTTTVTLTVTASQAPAITTQPVAQTVAPGATATFTAAASGSPTPTVQWQVSTNGGATYQAITGATSTTYSFAATAAQSGNLYEAVFTNTAGSVTTNPASLTVGALPVVTTQPASKTVSVGGTATFTAAATGSPAPTVQWQVSTNAGTTYQNITGATSTSYSFVVTAAETGNLYRAAFTNTSGTVTTNAATLTVHQAVTITTQPTSQTVTAGSTVTFTAAASGLPAPTVQWRVSMDKGSTYQDVTGATSPTLSFVTTAAESGYLYHANFTNVVGTVATNTVTLTVH